jgi:hypothetical protein
MMDATATTTINAIRSKLFIVPGSKVQIARQFGNATLSTTFPKVRLTQRTAAIPQRFNPVNLG